MKYPLGFASWLMTGSLPERIEFLADAKFDAVAFSQKLLTFDEGERREAAALLRERNMILTYHGNVQGNLKNGALDPDYARRMCDDVLWWHNNAVPVLSCCSDQLKDPAQTLQLMKIEAEKFANTSIGFGFENSFPEPGNEINPLDPIDYFYREAGELPNIGMILDLGHSVIRSPYPLDELPCRIPFHIYEIHISDNHGENDEHLPPGEGTINFAALWRGLERKGFDGVVTLEFASDAPNERLDWYLDSPEDRQRLLNCQRYFLEKCCPE